MLHFEAGLANDARDVSVQLAAAGEPPPDPVESRLPSLDACVRSSAVLTEQQPPARLQHTSHSLERCSDIGDGTHRERDEHRVHAAVVERDRFARQVEKLDRELGGGQALFCTNAHLCRWLERPKMLNAIGAQKWEVVAATEAHLQDAAGCQRRDLLAQRCDQLGAAREVDESRFDMVGVETHTERLGHAKERTFRFRPGLAAAGCYGSSFHHFRRLDIRGRSAYRNHLTMRDSLKPPSLIVLILLGALAVVAVAPAVGHPARAGRLTVVTPGMSSAVRRDVATAATRALRAAERALGHAPTRSARLEFVRTTAVLAPDVRALFHPWTAAITRTRTGEVYVVRERLTSAAPNDLYSVLVHEFVHEVLGDLEWSLSAGARSLPRWLHEGLAQVIAGSMLLMGNEESLFFRARSNQLFGWRHLQDEFPAERADAREAYVQSASFVVFVERRVGRAGLMRSIRGYLSGRSESLDVAMSKVQPGASFTHFTGDWIQELRSGRGLLAFLRSNCFSFLMVLAVPLLAAVLYKRFQRERMAERRLEAWEASLALETQRIEDDVVDAGPDELGP